MIKLLDQDFTAINAYIEDCKPTKIYILADENTHEHCLPILLGNLEINVPFEIIEVESGEENKTIETAVQLWEILAEMEADRKSLLINVGGGVITDMGGFVASTYKRGIKFINVPTSLLGMCDASIGGKTGIDHSYLKNIIGTFTEPEQIFVYPNYLKTLDYIQLRSGFAEMLKHALIASESHWKDLTSIAELTAESVAPYIANSMQIKQDVVEKDFRELDVRKTLNFGHTIGHGVESLFLQQGNLIPHGEAVALGMICETHLALLAHLITIDKTTEIIQQIRKYFPYINIDHFTNDDIINMMYHDKKNTDGYISFSLIDDIGHCLYDQKVSIEQIILTLDFYRSLKNQ
ncbi:3-dehydroquinate synthase [Chryseobacterium sp. T1]